MNYNLLQFLRNESLAEIVDTAYEGTTQLWEVYDPEDHSVIAMYMVLAGNETIPATQKEWDEYTQDDKIEEERRKMSQDEADALEKEELADDLYDAQKDREAKI